MKNNYIISGNEVIIYLQDGEHKTIISREDLQRAQEFPGFWFADYDKHTNGHYVHGKLNVGNGKQVTVSLHRWILAATGHNVLVDHKNHDTLNNTRCNIEIVNRNENRQNLKNVKGYWFNKRERKFQAAIIANKKRIHLGYFENETDAKQAYLDAKLKYHNYYAKIS